MLFSIPCGALRLLYFCFVVAALLSVAFFQDVLFVKRFPRGSFRIMASLFFIRLADPGGLSCPYFLKCRPLCDLPTFSVTVLLIFFCFNTDLIRGSRILVSCLDGFAPRDVCSSSIFRLGDTVQCNSSVP